MAIESTRWNLANFCWVLFLVWWTQWLSVECGVTMQQRVIGTSISSVSLCAWLVSGITTPLFPATSSISDRPYGIGAPLSDEMATSGGRTRVPRKIVHCRTPVLQHLVSDSLPFYDTLSPTVLALQYKQWLPSLFELRRCIATRPISSVVQSPWPQNGTLCE